MTPRRPRKGKRPTRSRGKAAAPRTETRPAKKSGKRSPVARRRPASDDVQVFLPELAQVVMHPQINKRFAFKGKAPPLPSADDDVAVFVAAPGAPIQVQADWVDDANTTYADMLARTNDGDVLVELPDARSLKELGFVVDRFAINGARCKYDCAGIAAKVPTIVAHHYSCPYWQNEGRDRAPF